MKFGNAAWGLRETPLERQLELTRSMGLELLEISIANGGGDRLQHDASTADIDGVRRLFERYGVRTDCAVTGNDFTGDDVATQLAGVRRAIEIAAALGARYLRVFAGFSSDSVMYGARLERMLAALRETVEFGGKNGVLPVVETHGGVTANGEALVHFSSASTRIDLLREILKTGAALAYDPANLGAVGMNDPEGFFTTFRPHIRYIHLKDFRDIPGGLKPAACGDPGRLDWARLMPLLADFDGPAMIEYELPGDIEDGLRRSLKFLQTFNKRK